MQFTDTQTAKITATIAGTTNRITFDGTTGTKPTPEYAKAQIDKIFDIVGKSVLTTKMSRTVVQEAVN